MTIDPELHDRTRTAVWEFYAAYRKLLKASSRKAFPVTKLAKLTGKFMKRISKTEPDTFPKGVLNVTRFTSLYLEPQNFSDAVYDVFSTVRRLKNAHNYVTLVDDLNSLKTAMSNLMFTAYGHDWASWSDNPIRYGFKVTEMYQEVRDTQAASEPHGWVQDTTWLVPPTSTVREIHLREEWESLSSDGLAKKIGI